MENVPLTVKEAEDFLKSHGRHYTMPCEMFTAIGVKDGAGLHGAAILGRNLEGDGVIGHIYVDGSFQGYSILYGCCVRAFMALGYKRLILK